MSSLGVNEMTFGEYMAVDTIVEGIDKVTASEVRSLAQELLDPDRMTVLIMGDLDTAKTRAVIS
jgi:predicted Zn-dependent peptidase